MSRIRAWGLQQRHVFVLRYLCPRAVASPAVAAPPTSPDCDRFSSLSLFPVFFGLDACTVGKLFVMESTSKPGKGFADDDYDDEEELTRREGSAQRGDGNGGDQKRPTTPRSKHSATEQRRRSKINDRFQILRELLPHNDQKRDKASFLLEVIEYIRFLQEKVQKYEAYPGWNQENAKLLPWKLPRDSIIDHPDVIKNGPSAPGYMFSGKFDDNSVSVSPSLLSNAQTEPELSAGVPYKAMETPGFSSEAAVPVPMQINLYDDMTSQSQSQWLRSSCPADCTVNNATLKEHEELVIDNGTISLSNAYSQELLTVLTQSLQSSGVDLSQSSISVQINLGKRAIRRTAATATIPHAKDHDGPSSGARAMGHSSMGSSGEDSEPAAIAKRHKSNSS